MSSAAILAALLLSIAGNALAAGKPADARRLWLLGEVHDNAAQHALRLDAFKALLARGARPALLMEQFDRERQGDIDRARAAQPPPDADALIAAAGGARQWNWAFYRPFVQLALEYDLPLLAANVSRQDARGVMAQGLAATGFDAAVPADLAQAHAQAIESSHCGQVDRSTANRMATAQIARDQFMAQLVEAHAARGVVLLAGNGHVRIDIGVPRWLSRAARERSVAVGYVERGEAPPVEQGEAPPVEQGEVPPVEQGEAPPVEQGEAPPAAFDRVVVTPRQVREDPCANMRAPASSPAAVAPGRAGQAAAGGTSIRD